MNNLVIIEEFEALSHECRGESIHDVDIYCLNRLNKLSKEIIEASYKDKWLAEDDSIEPLNGIDWSFEDLMEDYDCSSDKMRHYNAELNIEFIDSNDLQGNIDAVKLLINTLDKNSSANRYVKDIATRYSKEVMHRYFTLDEIHSCLAKRYIEDIQFDVSVKFKE